MSEPNWREWLRRMRGEGRPGADREIDDEVAFHLEMEAQKYRAEGMSPEEAVRHARMSFGAAQRFKEECRDERHGSHLDMLMQDVRYALRTLTRSWGFATAAILTLALGIGANTAIFSVIYGILLRPLPYQNGDQLVLVQPTVSTMGVVQTSIPELYDYREQASSFDELVEYHTMFFVLLGQGEPQRIETGVVSDNFFDTLGVTPLLGRTFVEGEDDLDSEPVLVLTYDYWRNAFGEDPDIIGKVFEVNTKPHTVVGVLPQIPQFPNEVDVYMPTSACPFRASAERNMAGNRHAFRSLFVFGRLTEEATPEAASAQVANLSERFQNDYPEQYGNEFVFSGGAVDLKDEITRNARPVLLMLLATAGVVLLIACANVANLSLARVLRRRQEVAVRAALGASRARLMRQLLTESTVLALIGGLLGLVLAFVGLDMLVEFAGRYTPRATQVSIDAWVLGFTLLVSVGTGLAFGSFPALPGTRDLGAGVKEGNRATGGGGLRVRRGLIVVQVALSFVLLVGAGLTLRSLAALQAIDPGFETEQVLTAQVSMDWTAYEGMMEAHDVLAELARVVGDSPVARAAALTEKAPFRETNPNEGEFIIDGRSMEEMQPRPRFDRNVITSAYFDVLEIPILAGRAFNEDDEHGAMNPVAIINETMAKQYWPDSDPIGSRVSFNEGDDWVTVVGVVGDTRIYGPETPVTGELYRPFGQAGMPTWLMVRTVGDPASAAQGVKDAAYKLGANPISDIETLATLRDDSVASPRLTASLLGAFALLALAVTITGIAGVMAFSISQRTRELGLRMALGAQRQSILTMVVRQGMTQVGIGLVLGVLGAVAFGRVLTGLLFDVEPSDPMTFALVVLALGTAALIAVVVPARRAVKVDPVIALRAD